MMRKFLLLMLINCIGWQGLRAQYVTLSGWSFPPRLQAMFPSCFNQYGQLDTTCTAITTLRSLDLHANGAYGPIPVLYDLSGIEYFDSLRFLNISGNCLSSSQGFRQLPPMLDTLLCTRQIDASLMSWYQLGGLPPLPPTLKYLDISENGVYILGDLNEGLRYLNCSNQRRHYSTGTIAPELSQIISLPSTLEYLYCTNNRLTSLPPLPAGLKILDVRGNRFVYNNGFNNFNYPGIACLPELPQSLDTLQVYGNRPITCLPNAVPGLYVDMVLEYCNLNNNPNGCPSAGPVPVQLTQFTVNKQVNAVLIQWTTAQEVNSDYFMVERSSDQLTWTPIRRVIAAGNSSIEKNYRTTDDIPARGINYYRIRSVDRDGQYALTTIKSVWWNSNSSILASPNPTRDRVTIYYAGNNKPVTISLYEPNGRLVKRLQSNSDQAVLDLSLLSAGTYFIQITGDAIQETSRLIKE